MASIRSGIGENMEESEAIEKLKNMRLFMQIEDENNDCKFTEDDYKANEMAINALEKQEKIKEAFEMWKAETGGYYGADDETTRFISTLNQILRSDEE